MYYDKPLSLDQVDSVRVAYDTRRKHRELSWAELMDRYPGIQVTITQMYWTAIASTQGNGNASTQAAVGTAHALRAMVCPYRYN